MSKRPMHCEDSESLVQLLRATFSGLGESSLQKAQQFYCSTGELSPPTVALAGPTDVQALTRRYMSSYMERRSLTDNMPTTWHFSPTAKDGMQGQANWIEIPKSNLHFFDGDSGEVNLSEECSDALKRLRTHHNVVRFRLNFHDAPEIDTAIRIYREKEGSNRKQTITTDSIGIRSLRAARELIFNATNVYFDISDHTQSDMYKRLLVDIWLLDDNAVKSNFAEELARMGCTYPFVNNCMHMGIYNAMLAAKEAERGMFALPDEVFASPFRPWEIRRHWKGKGEPLPEIYLRYYPVRNVDGETQPEKKWRGRCDLPGLDGEEDDEPSQSSDQFQFRLVQSPLSVEALCYKAPSTIGKEAGDGLFLKRHHREILKGSYLCTYEASSRTEEDINRSASSRTYVLEVEGKNTTTFFDAEVETANNLGRFANQPKVIEALDEVVRLSNKSNYQQMTDRDWKEINDMVASACNAVFARKGDALVLLAKDDIPPGDFPIEIFVSYGDMREYWMKHIAECPARFPNTFSRKLVWLLTSEECNWTDEQKCKWARKNV